MTLEEPTFTESQRFRQFWFLLVMAPGPMVAWGLLGAWVVTGSPTAIGGVATLLLWAAVGVALPILLLSITLHTRVDRTSVMFRYAPFHYHPRRISAGNLARAELVEFSPLRDFGGWGIRRASGPRIPKGTWCYTVSGTRGVLFTLVRGEPVLVGSAHPEQLLAAAQALRSSSP